LQKLKQFSFFYLKILALFYFNKLLFKNQIDFITKLELTEFIKNVAKNYQIFVQQSNASLLVSLFQLLDSFSSISFSDIKPIIKINL
jgi:hypothetical protein